MEFRTRYNRVRVFSNAGDPYLDTYKLTVDDDGQEILIKCGKDNIHNKIQAERSSCELKQILARLSKDEWSQFDISKGGLFGDFTQVPKTIKDMRERMLEANAVFKSLPVEVKEKFDFSADKFFSSIGTNYYNEVMSPYFETENNTTVVEEGVTE